MCELVHNRLAASALRKKAPTIKGRGQVKQSGSTLIFGPSYSASRRAEHFLLTSVVNYWWRVIFWTSPAETCYSAPKICLLKPMAAHTPEITMPKVNLSGMTVEALMDLRKRVDEALHK